MGAGGPRRSTSMMLDSANAPGRMGVWLIGARGSISTCVAYGLSGLRTRMVEPVGLCTQCDPLASLPLASLDDFVLGGHDVCQRSLHASAIELVREGILKEDLVQTVRGEVASISDRILTGAVDAMDLNSPDLDPAARRLGSAPPREQVAKFAADIAEFRTRENLDAVVVVHLASTEAVRPHQLEWEGLERFEDALDAGRAQPASLLYAYAAFTSRCPYVNFTPSLGASVGALRELARREQLPHCGNDGKTG